MDGRWCVVLAGWLPAGADGDRFHRHQADKKMILRYSHLVSRQSEECRCQCRYGNDYRPAHWGYLPLPS
jgi:hypothetical protein